MDNNLEIKTNKDKPRDYQFDNMRAILIILVVLGHVLTSMMYKSDLIESVYFFIFFFHMPAMTFISGFFSKNLEKARSTAFESILMPYIILNVCNYIFKMLIIQEPHFGFRFFRPLYGLWYLLALFLWKYFLKDLVRIRFLLPLSILLGVLSGFSKEFSDYLALGRVICFLPFFLLGYYCTEKHMDKIRRIPKIFTVAILVVSIGISAYVINNKLFKIEVLYLRRPFPQDSEIKAMLFRILVYMVAIAMTITVINLTSGKKSFLTRIGASTMTVYILHLFTIPILEKFKILNNQPYLYLVYAILMTAIIVYIYSRPWVIRIYDTVMNKLIGLILRKKAEVI